LRSLPAQPEWERLSKLELPFELWKLVQTVVQNSPVLTKFNVYGESFSFTNIETLYAGAIPIKPTSSNSDSKENTTYFTYLMKIN
jgi:hypothetical protein